VINEVSPGKLFLRAGHIEENSNIMREVTIYDLSDPTRRRTIYADSGNLALTSDGSTLELTLFDGTMQELPKSDPAQLQRLFYREDRIRVRGVGNSFARDTADNYKSDREMSICEMQDAVNTAERDLDAAEHDLRQTLVAATRALATGQQVRPSQHRGVVHTRSLGRGYCRTLAAAGVGPADSSGRGEDSAAAAPLPAPRSSKTRQMAGAQAFPQAAAAAKANPKANPKARPGAPGANAPRPVKLSEAAKRIGAQARAQAGKPAGQGAAQPQGAAATKQAAKPSGSRPGRTNGLVLDSTGAVVAEQMDRASEDAQPAHFDEDGGDAGLPVGGAPAGGTASRTARTNTLLPPVNPAAVGAHLDGIRARIEDSERTRDAYEVEIQKKFALAVACVVFVLLGAPIALRFPRGGVGLTIGVSLVVFALYYVGLIAGESLADRDILSPFWAMWAANVLFTAVGVFLLARMGREGSTARGGDVGELLESLRLWLARQGRRVGIPLDRRRHEAAPQQRAA